MNNKEFKLIKNGYIFEYNYNFGHINVDNELTGECEDCIEVGMGIIFPDQQSFESNGWEKEDRSIRLLSSFIVHKNNYISPVKCV